jgi:hypothetical protein
VYGKKSEPLKSEGWEVATDESGKSVAFKEVKK